VSDAGTGTAPLRALHVVATMAAEAGGPPVVCAGLANALARRGCKVAIAATQQPGDTPVSCDPSVAVHLFPVIGSARYASSAPLNNWLRAHVADFDIVHLHAIWQFPTFAAARACWHAGKPYVITPHGMLDRAIIDIHSRKLKRLYWLLRERRIEGRAAGIHCLNTAEVQNAIPSIIAMPKFILGNGISEADLAQVPPKGRFRAKHPEIADRPLALFLSRIHPKKGLDRLIPAWKKLTAKNPDLRFVIAGTGDAEYMAVIKAIIGQHQLEQAVLCIGHLGGSEKWEALVDADVFVLPSHQEGFSMAITESLAAGTPVVITRECNFNEVEQHRCGIIIPNGDMNAFVDAVDSLLRDPPRRQAMGAAGRELVSTRYRWESIAADLERIYRWIIAGNSFPPTGADVWR
jgi:glycosyltransferase involved in cell wall biosynthesis